MVLLRYKKIRFALWWEGGGGEGYQSQPRLLGPANLQPTTCHMSHVNSSSSIIIIISSSSSLTLPLAL